MPRTVRGLAFAVALICGVVTTLLAIGATVLVHRELERQLDARIEAETKGLLGYYEDHGFEPLARLIAMREQRIGLGGVGYLTGVDAAGRSTAYLLIDAQGRRHAGDLAAATPKPGWSEFVRFRRPDGSTGVAQAMNSTLPDGGQLIVAADRAVIQTMHWTMLKLFGVGWAVTLLLTTTAIIGFGRVVRYRLNGIETSAAAIMAGDFSRRMPLDGSHGEFDRLSLILNRMLDRISALLDNLRQVSGDIAHDLRTPLQRVRNRLDAMTNAATGAAHEDQLHAAIQDMDDLLGLFSSLLAISEIEGQSIRAGFKPVPLDEAVGEIADIYRPAMEDERRAFTVQTVPVIVRGDRRLLQNVVANLLDNALLHTPSGTPVCIGLQHGAEGAVLTVRDEGPGIPPAGHERAFRRLTRLDASRSTPGHGLGLSLVAAIVEAHGGTVEIVPSDTGLTIGMVLPAE
ncbi:MAG: two-component sensor histidine kinase [Sphingobium sp. 66-54]|nr:MAG: two-component sensor histidine kinase [Sphingobium sp. 66-54]